MGSTVSKIVHTADHAIKTTVTEAVKTCVADVSKSMGTISAVLPVDDFLKLPLIEDIMQYNSALEGPVLAQMTKAVNKLLAGSMGQLCANDVLNVYEKGFVTHFYPNGEADFGQVTNFMYYMKSITSGALVDRNAGLVNFSLLAMNPAARALMLDTWDGGMLTWMSGLPEMRAACSGFTLFFWEELKGAETLVADLIPIWANISK